MRGTMMAGGRRGALGAMLLGLWVACASLAAAQAPRVVHVGLSKNLRGEGTSQVTDRYRCPAPPTGHVRPMLALTAGLNFNISSNAPCDEMPNHTGRLTARWNVVLRQDMGGFGTHQGQFTWKDAAGNVATGTMIGTIGCGTHRPPISTAERCRAPLHFEGLLIGRFTAGPLFDKYKGQARMQASYAGTIKGPLPAVGSARAALDGVYIFPCPQPGG